MTIFRLCVHPSSSSLTGQDEEAITCERTQNTVTTKSNTKKETPIVSHMISAIIATSSDLIINLFITIHVQSIF